MIDAMPLPGVSVETLEAEILDELSKIARDGVSEEEFARTKNGIETAFVKQLQSIGSRADSFNSYAFYTHDTDFPAGDLRRYRQATTATLMEVIKLIFSDDSRRSTLIVTPRTPSGEQQ
jgi:predicted Zn-dependent peptidase